MAECSVWGARGPGVEGYRKRLLSVQVWASESHFLPPLEASPFLCCLAIATREPSRMWSVLGEAGLGSLWARTVAQAGLTSGAPDSEEGCLALAWLSAAAGSHLLGGFGASYRECGREAPLPQEGSQVQGLTGVGPPGQRWGPRVPGPAGEAQHHPYGLLCVPICIILKLIGLKATSLNHS